MSIQQFSKIRDIGLFKGDEFYVIESQFVLHRQHRKPSFFNFYKHRDFCIEMQDPHLFNEAQPPFSN